MSSPPPPPRLHLKYTFIFLILWKFILRNYKSYYLNILLKIWIMFNHIVFELTLYNLELIQSFSLHHIVVDWEMWRINIMIIDVTFLIEMVVIFEVWYKPIPIMIWYLMMTFNLHSNGRSNWIFCLILGARKKQKTSWLSILVFRMCLAHLNTKNHQHKQQPSSNKLIMYKLWL